jgi:hypothetical protein
VGSDALEAASQHLDALPEVSSGEELLNNMFVDILDVHEVCICQVCSILCLAVFR